jgi:hypothetical protein
VREVFEVSLEDVEEVHLHPADMRGAIVSLSRPVPPEAWRWGGPEWEARAARGHVAGAAIAVADPEAVRARWEAVLGAALDVSFLGELSEPGLVEIRIAGSRFEPFGVGGVRFVPQTEQEEG